MRIDKKKIILPVSGRSLLIIALSAFFAVLVGVLMSTTFANFFLLGLVGIIFGLIVILNPKLGLLFYSPLMLGNAIGLLEIPALVPGLNLQTLMTAALWMGILIRLATRQAHWVRTRLDYPILFFFLLVLPIWTFWNGTGFAFPVFERLTILKDVLFGTSVYFIAANVRPEERWLKRYYWFFLIVGFVLAVRDLVIYVQAGGGVFVLDWHSVRLAETQGMALVNGNVMLQDLFFSLALAGLLVEKRYRIWLAALAGLFALDIVLSFYRGAWLMLVVSLALGVLLIVGRRGWLVLVLLGMILAVVLPGAVVDRVAYTFYGGDEQITNQVAIDSTGRVSYHWPKAWNVAVKYFPWGAGFSRLKEARGDIHGAYNQYLNWFAELGLIGLGGALALIYALGMHLWREFHLIHSDMGKIYTVGLLCAWLGILVRNLTGDAFYYPWLPLFMMFLGAWVGSRSLERAPQGNGH